MKQVEKDASKEQRTRREAALASLLYHPYVCPARAFLSTPTYHYMVFDYVSGQSLLSFFLSLDLPPLSVLFPCHQRVLPLFVLLSVLF